MAAGKGLRAAIVYDPVTVYKVLPMSQDLLISAGLLHESLDDPRLRIVDCRFDLVNPEAGRSAHALAHIPGAVYADLDRDLAGPVADGTGRHPLPDVAVAERTLSRLGIDPDTRVVVYDADTGALASRAWWLLRWLGHTRAAVLDGGFRAWTTAGYAVETGDQQARQGDFAARPTAGRVLVTTEVAAAMPDAWQLRLVDARDERRFAGEAEPIDRVAGHVPGARNLPFVRCLDANGRWLAADVLRTRLETVLDGDTESPWAVMCGSGVTACHLVVSGLLAGCAEPRVYVGSWSEWIADPGRSIATGPG